MLVVQQMMRELLEMKAEIRVHINEEPHQIKDAVSNAVRQLVIEAFVDANVAQHKGDHEAIAERAQLRKTIEDENAAAIRKGLRELAMFAIKCILLAAVTGTGLYGVIKNQTGIGLDAPRATVEATK